MCHVYNEGGRQAAGYKGDAGDCVARAIAIASGLPHKQVYQRPAAQGLKAQVKAAETLRTGRYRQERHLGQ
jgi:hypothetical protein